jgi:hypothetical protein
LVLLLVLFHLTDVHGDKNDDEDLAGSVENVGRAEVEIKVAVGTNLGRLLDAVNVDMVIVLAQSACPVIGRLPALLLAPPIDEAMPVHGFTDEIFDSNCCMVLDAVNA